MRTVHIGFVFDSCSEYPGETFHDAQEEFSESSIDSHEEICFDDLSSRNNSPQHVHNNFHAFAASPESRMSEPSTPPTKKRRVIRSTGIGVELDFSADEKHSESEDSVDDPESCCASDSDNAIDSFEYKDVLILFRFNDHDLPFKLRDIIMANVRLLTLLESGLPSWVIFLQSYPGFCHLYRPWMCPLARTLYVLISVVTVLIGFYDLYKNVPVLKATAAHLCGPLFDWIESWEMVSRIKYLGTMLFLHNCQKAIKWFLMVIGTTRSFFSFLAQPLAEPLLELFECLLPLWNVCSGVVGSFFSVAWFVIGSSCSLVENLSDIVLQPLWFILSAIWTIGMEHMCVTIYCLSVSEHFRFHLRILHTFYLARLHKQCILLVFWWGIVVTILIVGRLDLLCRNFHLVSHILGPLGDAVLAHPHGPCIREYGDFSVDFRIWLYN